MAQSRTAPLPMRSAPSAEPTVDAVLRARHAGYFELFAIGTVRPDISGAIQAPPYPPLVRRRTCEPERAQGAQPGCSVRNTPSVPQRHAVSRSAIQPSSSSMREGCCLSYQYCGSSSSAIPPFKTPGIANRPSRADVFVVTRVSPPCDAQQPRARGFMLLPTIFRNTRPAASTTLRLTHRD